MHSCVAARALHVGVLATSHLLVKALSEDQGLWVKLRPWTFEPTSHVFQEHANFVIFLMFSVVLVGAEPTGLGRHSEAVALQGTRLLG